MDSITDTDSISQAESLRAKMSEIFKGQKEAFVLIGNTEEITMLSRSTHRKKIILDVDVPDGDETADGYSFCIDPASESFVKVVLSLKRSKKYVFICRGDDEKNLETCRAFVEALKDPESNYKFDRKSFHVYVFMQDDPALYKRIEAESEGYLSCVDRYKRLAEKAVEQHPLTECMTEQQIDFEQSVIKEGVNVNCYSIGFGRVNSEVFLTSVKVQQFLSADDLSTNKKVRYYLFDKENKRSTLERNYFRYQKESKNFEPDAYLPLPPVPAETKFLRADVTDDGFLWQLKETITDSPNDVHYFFVAFGSDFENVEWGKAILRKAKKWHVDTIRVIVLTEKEYSFRSSYIHNLSLEKEVFDIESITNDKILEMAQMRNGAYDLEYFLTREGADGLSKERVESIKAQSVSNWYLKKSPLDRESSLCSCLSLRTKLHLMGLDYGKGQKGISYKEFMSIYAAGDMPDTTSYNRVADGRPIIRYTLDFIPSRRKNLAVAEHYRWNAFMICSGMIPASIDDILYEQITVEDGSKFTNGKNPEKHRHGNLTTFDGLVEYRKLIASRDGRSESDVDVIKYDYQLLDDAYWLLTKAGYKIFPKTTEEDQITE